MSGLGLAGNPLSTSFQRFRQTSEKGKTLGRRHFATTADVKSSHGVSYSTTLLLIDKYYKKGPSQKQLTGWDDETLAHSRQQPCAGLTAGGLLFSVICWILEPSEKNQPCLFIHLYILNPFFKIT